MRRVWGRDTVVSRGSAFAGRWSLRPEAERRFQRMRPRAAAVATQPSRHRAGAASKADCPLIHLREDRDAASTVSTHDDSKLPFPPLPAQKARSTLIRVDPPGYCPVLPTPARADPEQMPRPEAKDIDIVKLMHCEAPEHVRRPNGWVRGEGRRPNPRSRRPDDRASFRT